MLVLKKSYVLLVFFLVGRMDAEHSNCQHEGPVLVCRIPSDQNENDEPLETIAAELNASVDVYVYIDIKIPQLHLTKNITSVSYTHLTLPTIYSV